MRFAAELWWCACGRGLSYCKAGVSAKGAAHAGQKKTTQGGKRMTKSGSAARHAGEPLDKVTGQQSPSPESSKPSHEDHGKAAPVFGEAAKTSNRYWRKVIYGFGDGLKNGC